MNADSALAQLWVTPKCDGDIGLRMGGAQKFSKVEFTHLFEKRVSRSQIVNPLQNHYIRIKFHSASMRRLPSLVKGAGFRSLLLAHLCLQGYLVGVREFKSRPPHHFHSVVMLIIIFVRYSLVNYNEVRILSNRR